jgi:hypothetical protein
MSNNGEQTAKIEALTRDVIALDATLAPHEAEVRHMIGALLSARPQVVPDALFLARLRADVLAKHAPRRVMPQTKASQSDMLWWLFRLAPIGAVAILVLVLAQPQMPYENAPLSAPESTDLYAPASEERAQGERSAGNAAPSLKMQTDPAGDTAESMMMSDGDDAVMTEDISARTVPTSGASVEVFGQAPAKEALISFVALPNAGYVRVYTYENDSPKEYLGMSRELSAGEYTDVPVALSRPVVSGEILYAQLFESDGDGRFDPERDLPLYDGATAGFVYTIFVVK